MYIGFFDSGMGGITVLHEAVKLLPDINYLYYADTLNVPYGTKEKNIVRKYIFDAVDFLITREVDALVIACNTATSIAIKSLREKHKIPIVGMEPAVKPAVERCKDKRVLVLATPLTLQEDKFEDLVSKVDSENIVDALPLPGLVDYTEAFQFDGYKVISYLKKSLSGFNLDNYGTVVLGCTHFIYFRKLLKKILPDHIDVIDGNLGTVNHLKNIIEEKGLYSSRNAKQRKILDDTALPNISFFISGKEENKDIFNKYLNILSL
ncbi:MAG: glutamate racemase [Bacillota bacterium]